MQKSGMVSIIGRPNAGKSTLLNKLVGEKVTIVANKPQTTRTRICGIVNRGETQIVFIDTPGFHKPRSALGRYMDGVVQESTRGVDCALLVVPPVPEVGTRERLLLEKVRGLPCILVINKIDTVPKEELLAVIMAYAPEREFDAVVPMSALNGDGLDILLDEVSRFIPNGPHLFPPDMTSDQSDEALIGEIIREKILTLLEREVPHGVAVLTESFARREDGLVECHATIFCEKDSHKGIIIGKNGQMLGNIGKMARLELEDMYGEKIVLKLWVKVKEDWRDNPGGLKSFGYQ